MAARSYVTREVYEPIEAASLDELRALQLERLKWTLRHAYENVPHYRRSFDAADVHPNELRKLEDLAYFPTSLLKSQVFEMNRRPPVLQFSRRAFACWIKARAAPTSPVLRYSLISCLVRISSSGPM